MSESKFRVILDGLVRDGEKTEDVGRRLAALFHVDEARVIRLLQGSKTIISAWL